MNTQISTLLSEQRRFTPPPSFAAQANATETIYDEAAQDREAYWANQARTLDWFEPWTRCSTGSRPTPSGSWMAS